MFSLLVVVSYVWLPTLVVDPRTIVEIQSPGTIEKLEGTVTLQKYRSKHFGVPRG